MFIPLGPTGRIVMACGIVVLTAATLDAQRAAEAPPRRASLHLATGELTRDETLSSGNVVVCWANTDWSGLYTTCGGGQVDEWLDWGVVACSTGSDIVGAVSFGYGTTALDPGAGGPGAALTMRFYDGAVGGGSDAGLPPAAEFRLTGLPGSQDGVLPVTWIVDLDLRGGFEFRRGAGPFGFSLTGDDDDGFGQSRTGPMLCFAGDGAGGADANGQVDFFDLWFPDLSGAYNGTWNFGGPPADFTSWYLVVRTADGHGGPPASSTIRNDIGDTNARVYTCTAPVLGERFLGGATLDGHAAALFAAYAAPLELPLAPGVILVDFTHPAGDLLSLPAVAADPAGFDVGVPLDLTLCGTALYTQVLRFGGGISLTNACDAVVGF